MPTLAVTGAGILKINILGLKMNNNYSVIRMTKRDYFALPDNMRKQSEGPLVMATRNGEQTFVRVEMLE